MTNAPETKATKQYNSLRKEIDGQIEALKTVLAKHAEKQATTTAENFSMAGQS